MFRKITAFQNANSQTEPIWVLFLKHILIAVVWENKKNFTKKEIYRFHSEIQEKNQVEEL